MVHLVPLLHHLHQPLQGHLGKPAHPHSPFQKISDGLYRASRPKHVTNIWSLSSSGNRRGLPNDPAANPSTPARKHRAGRQTSTHLGKKVAVYSRQSPLRTVCRLPSPVLRSLRSASASAPYPAALQALACACTSITALCRVSGASPAGLGMRLQTHGSFVYILLIASLSCSCLLSYPHLSWVERLVAQHPSDHNHSPRREIYVKSHICLWEHSGHFRLIGRGVPSVSVVSQLVYIFLCLASPRENPQVPIRKIRSRTPD